MVWLVSVFGKGVSVKHMSLPAFSTVYSHDLASNPTMHTKPASKEASLPSSHSMPPALTILPGVEISEETYPKISEPSSPASEEEDFSSGGEQISFHDDAKAYMHHQFYMMPIPNGMSGAGADGMMPSALPNTAWGGAADAGMLEGRDDYTYTFLIILRANFCF